MTVSTSPEAAAVVGSAQSPLVAVVVPVKNEADNILPLIEEIQGALDGLYPYEIVYVDDGSDDATPERLQDAKAVCPHLRVIRHRASCGQSAAVATGVRAARATWIATLDGDGQNDPADIPKLLEVVLSAGKDGRLVMACGRRAKRQDTWLRRLSSRVANGARARLLKDDTPDSGCGLKVFARETFLFDLPRFDHMHRFLPALMLRVGGRPVSVPVHHRPRLRGTSKYGLMNRLWVGIVDLLGVMWLQRRARRPVIEHEDV